MIENAFRWLSALFAVLILAGCTAQEEIPPTPAPEVLTLNITPAAWPVVPAVNACAASLSGFQVEIEERFASQADRELLIRLGEPPNASGFLAQIAADELAVALHPEHTNASLTTEDIQAIFSGQVTSWAEYGLDEEPVEIWVPLAVDETRLVFDNEIMQSLPVVSDAGLAPAPEIMQQIISTDPNAIGYLPNAWKAPGIHTILLGIRLPVLVVSKEPPQGPAADLIACLQGEVGQQALAEIYP